MRSILFVVFILLLSFQSFSQQFGGNPSSLKWRQINTDTARIIFPEGLDSAGQRVASIVHYLAQQKPLSLGDQLKKINIVLQNQTTIANGYVNLGPFRSEFFLTPDLNNLSQGSISWADQLALHEYRHVQQFNNFNNGLSHLLKVLSGEDGYSLAINAAVPEWFFEGDAVYNETFLSKQGRGRLPHFLNAYPALWQAQKNYSWMKLRNGSFKDYVPNHYFLGYLLVNYGREKYGADFWTKVTRDASAFKGLFYPFQKAIQKYAGVDYETFRNQAFDYYKSKIDLHIPKQEFIFPVNSRFVTSYYFPYRSGDSLIYLKASFRKTAAFYIKDRQGEHLLRTRDISIDEQFSCRNGKIVYAAYETDPRWSWKDYSVIKILDVKNNEQKTLTRRTKYFTPDISADGKEVAAVLVEPDGKNRIDILDADDGHIIRSISSADIQLFTDPKFMDDDHLVSCVRLKDGKMALAIAEISTGNSMRLVTPSYNVVGYPCVENGIVFYTASYGGNDDIYALNLDSKKLYRLTNGPLGNYYVNASSGILTWSVFTAEGLQLKQANQKDLEWTEISTDFLDTANTQDILSDAIQPREFHVTKYSKGTKLLNFHSWRPYYSDPIFTYSIYGENILNTLQTELYYLYNQDEKTSAVGLNATYGALYPYISIGSEYTFNRQTQIGNRIRRWDQLDTRVGFLLPFHTVHGKFFSNTSLGTNFVLRNEFNKDFYKDSLGNTSFSYLLHTFSRSSVVQRTVQQVYPRFGYSVLLNHRHAITRFEGYQFLAAGTIYLPGLISNQNILITGAFQQRDTLGQVVFSDRFSYSRGYVGAYFSRMWRLSANYHLPILYPDWGFGNILYLQSIRLNGFYDYTKVYSRNKKQTAEQRSVGGELFVDTKWWNQYPLTFGLRVSYLLDPDLFDGFKGTVFEFVLPVSIFPR